MFFWKGIPPALPQGSTERLRHRFLDDTRITYLPLNGRNVMALASLVPGVSTVSAPQVLSDSRSGPTMTVHGGRDNQNYLMLDGTYLNHPSRNTMMNPPPPDAVREFRIITQNLLVG